jgi:hypothetical protein
LILAFLVVVSARAHALSFDLTHAYVSAARAVLHGRSPYPPPTSNALLTGSAYVYTPLLAWFVIPFTVLPLPVTAVLGFVLATASIFAVLLLLGVRDWRCAMIAFLWVPTFSAIQTANLTLVLTVGVAALWRWRHRTLISGILLGGLIALKLYLWPLAVFFLGVRRHRAVVAAGVTALLLTLGSWAPIGFAGLRGYPHLLDLTARLERQRYTLNAALAPLLSWRAAELVGVVIGLALLSFVWSSARRGDERRAFTLAIGALLALSPIVPMNYFVVLLVVIALYRPTFDWLWALPLALWVGPQVSAANWQTLAALAIVAATFALAIDRAEPSHAIRGPTRSRTIDISQLP